LALQHSAHRGFEAGYVARHHILSPASVANNYGVEQLAVLLHCEPLS